MTFRNSASLRLKYQKTKAKLNEYRKPHKDYPKFTLNSADLSFDCTLVLSQYCDCVLNDTDVSRKVVLQDLYIVSEYYDALFNSDERNEYKIDFLLLAICAYYLTENYGSALALLNKANSLDVPKKSMKDIVLFMNYIFGKESMCVSMDNSYIKSILGYLDKGTETDNIANYELEFLEEIYGIEDEIDFFYTRLYMSILKETLKSSSYKLLPYYCDNDETVWEAYLTKKRKSVKILWPSQKAIGNSGLLNGVSGIVSLPTGVGKTKSIELIIRSRISKDNRNILIVAPLRSLCHEITNDMRKNFYREIAIKQFSDILEDDYSTTYKDCKSIIVSTPEKLAYVIHHSPQIIDTFGQIIFDEAHIFDSDNRGVLYELLVSEVKSKANNSQQLILLSAVLPNVEDIRNWLFNNKGAAVTAKDICTTPKSIGYTSKDKIIHYYLDSNNNNDDEDFFIPNAIKQKEMKRLGRERNRRYFPDVDKPKSNALYFANELCINGGVAIYVNQRKIVRTLFKYINELNERGLYLNNLIESSQIDAKKKISNLFSLYYGENNEYSCGLMSGVYPHYSNLPSGIKASIENAYKGGEIKCVVCTSTLAQGVNLPIKYLLITSIKQYNHYMKTSEFLNLVGRTARSGIYTEGSILLTDIKLYDNKNRNENGNLQWAKSRDMFKYENSDKCLSALYLNIFYFCIEDDFEASTYKIDISDYILKGYNNGDILEYLENTVVALYEDYFDRIDRNLIVSKIKVIIDALGKIENYLYSEIDDFHDEETTYIKTIDMCKKTYAYYLCTDKQKEQLIKIFEAIVKEVMKANRELHINYPSKTMLSIKEMCQLASWINDNEINHKLYDYYDLLDLIIELQCKIRDIGISYDEYKSIIYLLLNNSNYLDINAQLKQPNMLNVEKIVSYNIQYDLSFIIGNIIDLIELDVNKNSLEILQKQIKYGSESKTVIMICENIFDDRLVAYKIGEIVGLDIDGYYELGNKCLNKRDEITAVLSQFPNYFEKEFNRFINNIEFI